MYRERYMYIIDNVISYYSTCCYHLYIYIYTHICVYLSIYIYIYIHNEIHYTNTQYTITQYKMI